MRNLSHACGRIGILVIVVALGISLAAGQNVTVTSTGLTFSNQVLGSSSPVQTITLNNGQSTALKISNIATTGPDYSQSNNCPLSPSTLAAGKTCTISVTFTPAALGLRSGSLKITDNSTNSPQTVTLSGTGIAAVTVTPAALYFGNQAIGLKSAGGSVTVTNNQAVSLSLNSIGSGLADYTTTSTCPPNTSALAAGASCTISVFFTPAASGARSATLTVSDNASNSPTVSLNGMGVIAASTSAASLTFASQALGTGSAPQTVTFSNNQSASLTISSLTSNSTDFALTSTCPVSPAVLAGGGTCTAAVTFSPKAVGARTGTLSFIDSANNSPQTIALSGTGAPANLVSIAVSPLTAPVAAGKTQQFAATGTYSDGSTKSLTSSATWTSSLPAVASVNAGGLATGLTQGVATITASSGAIAGSATLTVTAPVLTSIAVTPATANVPLGTGQQFTATGTYSNGSTQNLTSSANWSSSSVAVASISGAGLATSATQGSTTITATSGTISGSTALTVGAPALVSIAVTPATASVALGSKQQFMATGTYTNGSTQNLTSSATWSSSTATVAGVSSAGLASSLAQGSATITATSGTIKGSAALTVGAPALVSIAVTPATPSIALGTSQQFTATGTYTNGSTQNLTSSVTWTSSSATVANVSSAGLATSLAQGSTTITATSGTIKGSAALTVGAPALLSMAVTPATPSIALGTSQQFTATGTYTNGSTQNLTSSATWSSSTATVASISRAGLASSLAQGSTTITAASGTIKGSTTLTVGPPALVSIAVTPATPSIALGTSQQFTATGTYTNGSTQNLTSLVNWNSSSATVASISAAGLATSLAQGSTTITATSGTISGSAALTVGAPGLVSIAVTPAPASIALGTSQQFTATGTYTNGSTQNLTTTATWTSSTAAVAGVSSAGLATSLAQGSTAITATLGAIKGSTTLTVGPPALVSIAVSPATPSIALGTSQQFTATGTYTNGSTQNLTSSVTWTSSSATVASIGSAGLALSLAQGSTTITATSGTISGSAALTVGPPALVSIAVTPATASIALGTSQQFTATGTYTNGSTQNLTSSATWTSSTAAVAGVSSAGLASSVGKGNTTITAASGAIKGAAALTVGPPTLVSIAVTPAPASIALGTSQQFTATGTYTDGSTQNLTASVSWSSSAATVASVNGAGLASSASEGSTTITATSGAISGWSSLTVTPPVLVAIAVTPPSASIPLGTTQQFTATGTYSDGSTQNLTTSASWSSSPATVASVSSSGLAFGAAEGSGTITAASGTFTASAAITVGQPALVSLAITPANASFALGTTLPLKAIGTYTDGSTLDVTTSVAWSAANSAIATVSSQGTAASVAIGSTSVTATLSSITGTTTITVNPAVLVSIAVTPAIPTIPLGTTMQFSATGTFTDGSTQNLTATVQWSSDTTSVATIGNSSGSQGLATSVETGTANIIATSGSVQGSTALTVTAAALVSIAVTPATPSIALGTTQQFVATGTYTDGSTQNLTSTATWSSDTLSSATVSSGGLASTVAVGTATISATANNISGSTLLTITPAQLVSIAVNPPAVTTQVGTTQAFTALGTFTDGTTQDVTQSGHWSSSNAAAATISNTPGSQGLASALGTGTTSIGIALGAVSGTATLTVNPAALVTIALSPQTSSIPLGTAQQFTATGTYTDGSTQNLTATVQWSSSSATVAVISAAGLATSAGTGTATITATQGSVTASTTLTVGQPAIVSIAVAPSGLTIPLGTSQQFQALATYTDGSTQDLTASATWTSDTQSVALVSSAGLVSGIGMGAANITAASGGVSGSSAVTVGPPLLVSLTVTPPASSIPLGTTQQFDAVATYTNGATQDVTGSVTWSSSSAAASVGATGVATATALGTATITASAGSISASSTLTVGPPVLVSLAITPANASFALGTTLPLKAIGTYTDGSTLDVTTSVAWSTANSAIASVSSQGTAASVAIGSTSVTATLGSITGTTTITVNPAVLVSIAVTPAIPTIPLGTTMQFSATGTFTDGSTQNLTATVQWSSDTTSVATIGNGSGSQGLATSVETGTANIIATSGSVQGSTALTVTAAALVSIAVTPATPSIALGTTQQFVATGTYTDGSTQNLTSTATWSSDTLSSATVSSSGLASTVAVGTATISATANNISGSTLLTITPAQLVSIAVNPPAVTTQVGTTQAFTALGTFTDGTTQDVTQSGHWSSSNAAAATISNTPGSQGLASALGTGTTSIGIALGAVSGTATLTVNPAALVTIAVSPQTPSIPLGTAQQFTATGTYTDGSTQNLTATVQWSSSSATVAVMSAAGLATSAGTGTATITATQGTVTASTTLTVGQSAMVSLAVLPTAPTIVQGATQQFQALATYTDGSTQDLTASATWTSSAPGVATVNAAGLASALSGGSTTIGAVFGGFSGGAVLTVTIPATPVSLAITPATASIAFGAQEQLQAFLTYSDGSVQNVTSLVAWSSSATTVATIGSTGLASGVGAGNAIISARASNGMIAGSTLTVGSAPAAAVLTTPVPGSTLSGSYATFTWTAAAGASGYYLTVGSVAGGSQYYQSGNLGALLATTVNALPANGSTVYVTLYSLFGVAWSSNSYTYTSLGTKAMDFGPPPATGASCGLTTPTWAAGHFYPAKSWVQPSPANGHFYRTAAAGTSGASQPAFSKVSGSTTSDNGISWVEQGTTNSKQCPDDVSLYVYTSGKLDGVTLIFYWSSLESSNNGCTAHASYNFAAQMDSTIEAILNDSNFPPNATVGIILSGVTAGSGPNTATPCYVFSSTYAKSLAASSMPVGFCTSTSGLGSAYPGSGSHANSNAVFTDGADTTGFPWTPSVPYSTAWEAFQDAAIAHINASSYASRVSYQRVGVFQSGEAFPHCINLFKNYFGASEATMKATVTGFANSLYEHEASRGATYPLMAGIDGTCVDAVSSCGVGYGWADSEAASAVSAFSTGGFGSEGLTESDIAAFNTYGYADGGTATSAGTYCASDYCSLFHDYPSQPVLELQTLAASCPQGLNQCTAGTQQSQTGTLVNILPFVTLMKTTNVELYNQDWLCAYDPNYLPCASYAAAYAAAIANVRAGIQ